MVSLTSSIHCCSPITINLGFSKTTITAITFGLIIIIVIVTIAIAAIVVIAIAITGS